MDPTAPRPRDLPPPRRRQRWPSLTVTDEAAGVDGPAASVVEAEKRRRAGRRGPRTSPSCRRWSRGMWSPRWPCGRMCSRYPAVTSGSACSRGRAPSPTSHSATRDKQEPFCFLFATLEEYDSRVMALEVDEKPTEDYNDIGALEKQIQELVEALV